MALLIDTYAPNFLLIQYGRILDVSSSPVTLSWSLVNAQADIYVAVGCVTEYGEREVIGVCGRYRYVPFAEKWKVSIDERWHYQSEVSDNPGIVLRDALYELKKQGRLSDVVNFSEVTLQGI
jgi:hypothetical protein